MALHQNHNAETIPFTITLKRTNTRAINAVSLLLLTLFILAFVRYWMAYRSKEYLLLLIPVMILFLIIYGFARSRQEGFVMHFRTELMMAAMATIFLPIAKYSWAFGIALFAMSLLERFVKRPDEFYFSDEGIERNSIPRKKIEWVEVENVMVRNGLFTLDLRNNKLIQQPLDEPVEPELEEEFNAWSRERLLFTQGS